MTPVGRLLTRVRRMRGGGHHTTGYLRTTVGAEQRNKFVFIRWLGERVSPMARARFFESEAAVKKTIKARPVGGRRRLAAPPRTH